MENNQACVWATSRDLWDSFLNDPDLALAIESARSNDSVRDESSAQAVPDDHKPESAKEDEENQLRIGARLRAYETPITDEILRQSIR